MNQSFDARRGSRWSHAVATAAVGATFFVIGACSHRSAESDMAEPGAASTSQASSASTDVAKYPEVPADVRDQVLQYVKDYRNWKRVSDQANWAPELCRMPSPAGIQISESDDLNTHGGKLYYLYARHDHEYINFGYTDHTVAPEDAVMPVGQMIVKESYEAVQKGGGLALPNRSPLNSDDVGATYAVKDGKCYFMGDRRELFVMYKAVPGSHATALNWSDNGWVYATLPADGSRIDHIGRISSCMGCHVDAPFDRCFGLPHARATHEARKAGKLPR